MSCKHLKPDQTPCQAPVMKDNQYCYQHNPEIPAEEKKAAQGRGGTNRSAMTVADPLPALKVKEPDDVVLLLADTVNRVRAGELDIRVANCLGVLSGHLIKAMEVATLKDRVETIERVILERKTIR